MVVVRVENDFDVVVFAEFRVASHFGRHDLPDAAVLAAHGKVQSIPAISDPDLSGFGRLLSGTRLDLHKVADGRIALPLRFAESSIDVDSAVKAASYGVRNVGSPQGHTKQDGGGRCQKATKRDVGKKIHSIKHHTETPVPVDVPPGGCTPQSATGWPHT